MADVQALSDEPPRMRRLRPLQGTDDGEALPGSVEVPPAPPVHRYRKAAAQKPGDLLPDRRVEAYVFSNSELERFFLTSNCNNFLSLSNFSKIIF